MVFDSNYRNIGIVLVSKDFKVVGLNPYAEEILGSEFFVLGKNIFQYHPKKSYEKIKQIIRLSASDNIPTISMSIDVLSKVLMINFSRFSSIQENESVHYTMSFIDITADTNAIKNENSGRLEMEKLPVFHQGSLVFLEPKQIFYCQADGNYCRIFARDDTYYVHQTLKQIFTRFSPQNFFQVHKSYVVNLEHAKQITKDSNGQSLILFDDPSVVPLIIARRRLKELKDALLVY